MIGLAHFRELHLLMKTPPTPISVVAVDVVPGHADTKAQGDAERSPVDIEIGQWYWVNDSENAYRPGNKNVEPEREWLACVTKIGSNFVELYEPRHPSDITRGVRVHFDDLWAKLRFEPHAAEVIANNIRQYQMLAAAHLAEVKAITAKLGVSAQSKLTNQANGDGANALVLMSGQEKIKDYEKALILARDKQLPELFKALKVAHADMTKWMTAETVAIQATTDAMMGTISDVNDRVFNVSLYAGLTEHVVKCRDGEPAGYHEKLHVMQRMAYMDEECLLNYRHGGMDFKHIRDFDAWISEDDNRDRILPFPKSIIAMRVRRRVKERQWDGSLLSLFIKMQMEDSDKFTYLYIRNGEQVYRLSCDIDFGETLFPDKSVYDPSAPLMAKTCGSAVCEIMTRDEYDQRVTEKRRRSQLAAESANGDTKIQWPWPFDRTDDGFREDDWKPFDQSNVYFDEIAKYFADKIKEHNRIALIIQGLYDRSEVLHPHPPAKMWSPDGFARAINLIYDGGTVLHNGETPDFDSYMQRCNASLGLDSVVVGQELYWMEKEGEKESDRLSRDHSTSWEWRPKTFIPHGNPGPGYLARMFDWKPRSRIAIFVWERQGRLKKDAWSGEYRVPKIRTTITVPADRLFNVSAYQPGDYLQFFKDSRTRAAYLKWAPMLPAAEEYHAGREGKFSKVREPVKE